MRSLTSTPWITLLAALLLTSAVAVTGGTDPTQPVKFMAFALIVAVGLATIAARAVLERRVPIAAVPAAAPVAAFVAVAVLVTMASQTPLLSVMGSPFRFDGLVVYGALGLLVLLAMPLADPGWAERFLLVVVGGLAIQVFLATLDLAGVLPDLGAGVTGAQGSLGNPNFFGAFVGMAAGPALWLALRSPQPGWGRAAGAVLTLLAMVFALASNAAQGPVTAVISIGVVVFARLLDINTTNVRRAALGMYVAAGTAGVALLALGFTGRGPLADVAAPSSFLLRTYFWRTAAAIGAQNPLTGLGFDTYYLGFREYRPLDAVAASALTERVDAAHSVPLQHFASGGWPLLIAYIAMTTMTAVAAVLLMRRQDGNRRLTTAAVIGVWLGYQVQSVVSIDVLPLPVVGWSAMALLLGLAFTPAAPESTSPRGPRGREGRRPKRPPTVRGVMAGVVVLLIVVPALVYAPRPFRADRLAAEARMHEAGGDLPGAARRYLDAGQLMPWNPDYPSEAGQILLNLNEGDAAKDSLNRADEIAGRGYFAAAITLFRIAVVEGDDATAMTELDRALELEPYHPDWLTEAAEYLRQQGMEARAAELDERIAAVRAAS